MTGIGEPFMPINPSRNSFVRYVHGKHITVGTCGHICKLSMREKKLVFLEIFYLKRALLVKNAMVVSVTKDRYKIIFVKIS